MRTSIISLTQYSLQALLNSFAKRIAVAINFSKHLLGCDERILLIKIWFNMMYVYVSTNQIPNLRLFCIYRMGPSRLTQAYTEKNKRLNAKS